MRPPPGDELLTQVRAALTKDADATSPAKVEPPMLLGPMLAGYGAAKRRLLFPDILGRYAHAFWFKPSVGGRDPITAKALVLATPGARLAWVTLDLIAVDGAFVRAVQDRLTRAGVPPTTLIVSASHTHSGPGAFMQSRLMGFVAVDRLDPAVRDALVDAAASAVQQAERVRGPALAAAATVNAAGLTASRAAVGAARRPS